MTRVLIADDSATARHLMRAILEADPLVRVIGEARDGAEAVSLAEHLAPDLIVMDVHMPNVDGLAATEQIMSRSPRPILMVSAIGNDRETDLSLSAMQAGALAGLPKPVGPDSARFEELSGQFLGMVKAMATVKVVRRWGRGSGGERPAQLQPHHAPSRVSLVAIAASTGGPAALHTILGNLPATFPAPVLVVQHIARDFTHAFAEWLGSGCALTVRLAVHRETPRQGTVYVAPDDAHMRLDSRGRIELSAGEPINGFRPSADPLFESAARVYGAAMIGVILTGMGSDGAEGLAAAHERGAYVIGQDEGSSVIFGMAQEAARRGAVDRLVPLDRIAAHLLELAPASQV